MLADLEIGLTNGGIQMNQTKKENPKMIVCIDGSVITKKKALSVDTMINDMEKRLLYVLHRLPELEGMKAPEKINYLKGLFNENGENNGKHAFAGVLKSAEPIIVEKISKQFGLDLADDEKSFSKAIEKIKINIPNLYAICDLISSGVEDIINNDLDRIEKAKSNLFRDYILSAHSGFDSTTPDYWPAYNDAISKELMSGSFDVKLDERRDMLLDCYIPAIDNIYKLVKRTENRGIKLVVLTQNDPVMNRVLASMFPQLEVNVVPNENLEYKRKNDPNLYGLIIEKDKEYYGTYIPHVLVDDSIGNINAATEAGWGSFYINSKESQTALEEAINGPQKRKK